MATPQEVKVSRSKLCVRHAESFFALADSIESRLAEATAQVERTTKSILAKAFRGELGTDNSEGL